MALNTPTMNNPDPSVSQQYGLSGWLDGLANLTLMYGATKIKSEFPEQFQTDQNYNPQYQQDNAVNDARYSSQAYGQSNNFANYALLGLVGLAAVGLLVFAVKR